MEIFEVNATEFKKIIPDAYHVFGSAEFADLNSDKANPVHYLLFKDGKYRLGLTGGIRGNTFYSPFSAPYGGFVFLNKAIKIQFVDNALRNLINWANEKQLYEINITLPPEIYHPSLIAKHINALYRAGFILSEVDLNYSFLLQKFSNDYLHRIWRNARKNLRIALKQNLVFKRCNSEEEKYLAYEVIRKNRTMKEFPLRMSREQVEATTKIILADFFLVFEETGIPIASAIVFHVSDNIAQVIYWGDMPEFASYKTMNFMSYKIFEYYKNKRIEIIDIGPSTENSIPNVGLSEFKESIGCDIQNKISFRKVLSDG